MPDLITVTVVRPPGRDKFGDPLPGVPAEFDIDGCLFAPGPSVENLQGANQIEADGTVYAPAGSDIRSTDRVRVLGDLYEVEGKPRDWGRDGLVVVLKLVTG